MIHTARIFPLGLAPSVCVGPPPWNIYADLASAFWWSAATQSASSEAASNVSPVSGCRLASEFL